MSKHPAPPIAAPLGPASSERLLLRPFRVEDVDELAKVFARPEVWRFPYGRAFSRAETVSFIEAQMDEWKEVGFGCWVARLKSTEEVIGYVGLSVPTFVPDLLPAVEVG